MRFYVSIECESCGNDVTNGPVLTLLEHRELPVVPVSVFEQDTFTCDRCGTANATGELPVIDDLSVEDQE